ncbi:ORF-11 [Porcine circovirus type 2-D]|uniref:ORF11 n=6 Tax=Porcine circovirus 2 TaxID=85708 RepID=O93202_PCV2|nr:ORF11 [Porcine circovirus 2]AAD03069.1 ORF-11 [Porcine circovirus type 2-C]AAD03080.1 ORF-11 [Porcine circovirus type 2-E]AAD03090.1 ORF-11 [Porcine circovirus type 2-B]AAD11937.1 ORF-11 [Bovine circovirus]AAD12313.1 ORF-11 [Porcine circovirus type 2-D]
MNNKNHYEVIKKTQ